MKETLEILSNSLGLVAGAAGVVGFGHFYMRRFQTKMIKPITEDLTSIKMNMSPNGGSSMRDAIDQIKEVVVTEAIRSELINEVLRVGIYETNEEGQCTYVSKEWCSLAGINRDEAKGNGWLNGILLEEREDLWLNWQMAIAQKRAFIQEVGMTNGRVMSHAIPSLDKNGNVTKWVGAVSRLSENRDN